MGRLILLAHAETAATRAATFPADEGITPRGRESAERLGAELPAFARVWQSPAVAARETAEALGYEATAEPALADLDYGSWRGRSIADLAPAALTAWRTDPVFAGHGGESLAHLFGRIKAWLDGPLKRGGTELGLTHAAVIRCAVLATLGAPADGFWALDIGPLTRVTLSSDGRRWSLREMICGKI